MPVAISISDLPVAPVALSFASEPEPAAGPPSKPTRGNVERATPGRRAAGWCVDLAFLTLLFGAHVLFAAKVAGDQRSPLSTLLAAPWLWLGLAGGLGLAWSWVFVTLWGRTPGMALTGQRLRLLRGGTFTPLRAFVRALFSAVSCGLALFGFALALFDPRGQTLHDKLCRCVAVVD